MAWCNIFLDVAIQSGRGVSVSVLLNYCSDSIAAAKEEKMYQVGFFFVKTDMDISLACRKEKRKEMSSQKVISQKADETLREAKRKGQFTQHI